MQEILDSLNTQRQKYLNSLSSDAIEINDYTSHSINFKISDNVTFDYSCDLPLFHDNNFFDAHFVNTFIQQKALTFISEQRKWLNDDDGFSYFMDIEHLFYFQISHSIKKLDKNGLSLTIFYDTFFGGVHPNTNIDTLNFKFNPERILQFSEIVKVDKLNKFLKKSILKYGDDEQKESLLNYINYITEDNVNFVHNDDSLEINFTNYIPRVMLAIGILEIPMKDIKEL